MSGGFILLHRSVFNHEVFSDAPFSEREAWIWLLTQASYEPHKIRYGSEMVSVGMGEVPTSYRRLKDAWKWGNDRVRRFLNLLESEGMISRKTGTGFLVVTIRNYGQYQNALRKSGTQAGTVTGTLTGTQAGTNITQGTQGKKLEGSLRSPSKRTQEKKPKVSLEELSTDHISDWLTKKRGEGKYLNHDEHFVLDQFKNYCQSKGKRYADYPAAYRNAFEWERCQPKPAKQSTLDKSLNAMFAARTGSGDAQHMGDAGGTGEAYGSRQEGPGGREESLGMAALPGKRG